MASHITRLHGLNALSLSPTCLSFDATRHGASPKRVNDLQGVCERREVALYLSRRLLLAHEKGIGGTAFPGALCDAAAIVSTAVAQQEEETPQG